MSEMSLDEFIVWMTAVALWGFLMCVGLKSGRRGGPFDDIHHGERVMSPIVTPVIRLRWSKRTGLVKTTEWRQMSWAEFSLNVALVALAVWVVM